VPSWPPALDGVVDKLKRGAAVADVGCRHGASTIVMAKAFPKSRFFGFDYHAPLVEAAAKAARHAGLTNVRFEVAQAKNFPGHFDLVVTEGGFGRWRRVAETPFNIVLEVRQ